MRSNLFWLSDEQWQQIEPHLPTDVRGVERADDRRVISGILHILKSGCRWKDCPPEYGPPTTIYNRFVRWAERGVWEQLFRALAERGRSSEVQMIDSTQAIGRSRGGRNTKIHALADAKSRFLSILLSGGEAHDYPLGRRLVRRAKGAAKLLGDKAYDGDDLRHELKERGTVIAEAPRTWRSSHTEAQHCRGLCGSYARAGGGNILGNYLVAHSLLRATRRRRVVSREREPLHERRSQPAGLQSMSGESARHSLSGIARAFLAVRSAVQRRWGAQ